MRGFSALVFSAVVFCFLNVAANPPRPLAAEDVNEANKAARRKEITDLGGTQSTTEICISKLEKGNDEYTYKFVKSNSGQFEIVEIPKSTSANSYIRYYTSSGFAEINAGSAQCNHNSKKKDAKTKLMDIFKATDDRAKILQEDYDRAAVKVNRNGLDYFSELATFRIVCGDAFPEIGTYLEKNNELPVSMKTRGQRRDTPIGASK